MTAARRLTTLALVALCGALSAQPEPKMTASKEPDAKLLLEKFKAEREAAVKAKFTPESLARAVELVKRGEAALAAGDPKAARYFRDARWQVPYLPANLPPHVTRVFGESRMRHADRVNALSYSPDGTKLASASRDGTVKVWDLGNGRDLATYRGHAQQPGDLSANTNVFKAGDVAFSPDGKTVASASGTQVHLWEPDTGKQIKVLVKLEKTDKPLKAIAFRPDGKFLAVAGDDGVVRTYEVETGKNPFNSPPRSARIESMTYSPNGKLIAVGDSASQVAVYAPDAKNPLAMGVQAVRPGSETFGVAFTADSGGVFACGKDGAVQLFAGPNPDGTSAGNTSTRLREFAGHTDTVNALVVSPDGKQLVTAGSDRTVRVWDVTSAKPLRSFQGHMSKVLSLAVRGDGKQIASASDDGAIRLWDLNTVDEHRALTDAGDSLWAVAFSPDGKRVATAGADKILRVYGADNGKLEVSIPDAHKAAVTSLAFFPDGKLASAGGDRVVKVWDVDAKKAVAELSGHESAILTAAVGDSGKLIVSGAADRTVRGWSDQKQVWQWAGKSAVCAVAIRKGEKIVAAGTADGTLVVLDVTAGTPKELFSQTAHIAGVACVGFSPDGTRVATVGGDGAVRVWSVGDNGSLTALTKFEGQAKSGGAAGFLALTGLSFSPDGRYLATVGADTVVRVWDIQTKSESRGLRGHTDWVTAVAFSADGRYLASVGVDKAARVFELTTQETSAAGGHLLKVNAVAVSPDGKFALTAATDQTMKVWDLATGREVATLIGNTDVPQVVTFAGNDAVVLGATTQGNETVGQLHFWGTKPPRRNKSLPTGAVYALAALPDGSRVAAWSTKPAVGQGVKNNTFDVYDAAGELLSSLPDKGRTITAAAFSPDLSWAVAGDDQGTVRVWDLEKKERVGADWPLFPDGVGDLAVTPDKKLLVAIDAKGTVKVAATDAAKREVLGSVAALKGQVRGLLVSPKGDTFVTFSADREVRVWSLADPKSLKEVRSWELAVGVSGLAYTPDGKQLITANADGTAFVLQLP
jgi:WD40 repeat protein